MKRVVLPLIVFALIASPNLALSQTYPSRPLTIVVPFGPGGTADLAARTLAFSAEKYLGQTIIVQNKTGAGGIVGSQFVVDSQPDGYTLLLARVGSQAVAPALDPSTTYKWDSFTFLGMLELDPFVCIVSAQSSIHSVADLVQQIREKPGKLTYASTGIFDATVVFPIKIFTDSGLRPDAALKVPYRNGVDTVTAIMGGQVDFACNGFSLYVGGLRSGQLRGLVVSTPGRVALAPDIPTGRELGMKDLEVVSGWSALYGPPGLPKEVVDKWASVLAKIKDDPQWQERVRAHLSLPNILTAGQTRTFAQDQVQTYRAMAPKFSTKD